MNHSPPPTHLVWRLENGMDPGSPRLQYDCDLKPRGRPAPAHLSARGDVSYYRPELPTAVRSVTQVRQTDLASPRAGSPASVHIAFPVHRLRSAEPLPPPVTPTRVYQAAGPLHQPTSFGSRPRTLTEAGPRIVAVREAISPRRFVVDTQSVKHYQTEPDSVPVSASRRPETQQWQSSPHAFIETRRLAETQRVRARRVPETSASRPIRKPASSLGRVPESHRAIPRLPLRENAPADTPRPAALTSREPRGNATTKSGIDKMSVASGPMSARTTQQPGLFRPTPHKRGLAAGANTARPQLSARSRNNAPGSEIARAKTRPSGNEPSESSDVPSDTSLSTTSAATSAAYHPRHTFLPKQPLSTHLFETVAMIGQGGYAVVRVVRHRQNGLIFALKQVAKADFTNVQQLRMAYTEVEILRDASAYLEEKVMSARQPKNLRAAESPEEKRELIGALVARCGTSYFPKYYGCWQDESFIYFLMEYLPGGDLMKHLIDKEIFPEQMAKFYAAQIALAIGFMHDHLRYVHRDIKPDNVLFDAEGHSKLVDFGLSRKIPPPRLDANGQRRFIEGFSSAVGTPDYMAPEVHRPGVPHDRTIDWWSLGIILYEMLFGGPPLSDMQHRADVTSQLIRNWRSFLTAWPEKPAVSELAKDLLGHLIAEKADRYQTVEDVLSHPWFGDLDLNELRQTKPPIVPATTGQADVRNFDSFSSETLRQWEEKKRRTQPSLEVSAFLMEIRTRPRRIGGDSAIQIPYMPTGKRHAAEGSLRRPANFASSNDVKRPLVPQTCGVATRVPNLAKVETADAVSIRTYPAKRPAPPVQPRVQERASSRPATCDTSRGGPPQFRALHETLIKAPSRIQTDDLAGYRSHPHHPPPQHHHHHHHNSPVEMPYAQPSNVRHVIQIPRQESPDVRQEPPMNVSRSDLIGRPGDLTSRSNYDPSHTRLDPRRDAPMARGEATGSISRFGQTVSVPGPAPGRTPTGYPSFAAPTSSRSRPCKRDGFTPRQTVGGTGETRDAVSTVSSVAEPRTMLSSMSSGTSSRRKQDAVPPSQIASAATETGPENRGGGLLSELTMAVSRWLTSSSSGSVRSSTAVTRPAAGNSRAIATPLKATGTQIDEEVVRRHRHENALPENIRPINKH